MAKIFIGNKVTPNKNPDNEFIKCCSCHKYYGFKGNVFSSIKSKILICPHCGLMHKIDFPLFRHSPGGLKRINKLCLGEIDIGFSSEGGLKFPGVYTFITNVNPANDTGKITNIRFHSIGSMTNVTVATFFLVSGFNFTTRDYELIANVGTGETFHEVNLDVVAGDFIGFGSLNTLVSYNTGAFVTYYISELVIPCEDLTFSVLGGYSHNIYGTGETPPVFKDTARTGIYSFKTLE